MTTNTHKNLYEALVKVGCDEESAKAAAATPNTNAELTYELVRAQTQMLDKLDMVIVEFRNQTAHRERVEAKLRGEIKEALVRIDQVEDRVGEVGNGVVEGNDKLNEILGYLKT